MRRMMVMMFALCAATSVATAEILDLDVFNVTDYSWLQLADTTPFIGGTDVQIASGTTGRLDMLVPRTATTGLITWAITRYGRSVGGGGAGFQGEPSRITGRAITGRGCGSRSCVPCIAWTSTGERSAARM